MVVAPSAVDSASVLQEADRLLVEAHRHGEVDAFTAIVRTHYAGLMAYARRRLGSANDAEDAVQETLLRAFRGLDTFGSAGDWRLGAWLTRILANVCADAGARRQVATRLEDRLAGAGDGDAGDVAELVSDPVALAAVRTALAGLPVTQRRAFVLRVVEDLPYPEVAEQLGITEDNARARVQRARASLRQALAETRAISGAMAVAPLAAVGSLRTVVRRLMGRAVEANPAGGTTTLPPTPPNAGGTTLQVVTGAGQVVPGTSQLVPGAGQLVSGAGQLVSGAGQVASGAGQVASAVPAASPSVIAALNGPVSAGAQLVGQLAASPVGQAAMAVSASGAGKGSVVLGLAASLATAGALALPGGGNPSPAATPRPAAVRPATDPGGSTPDGPTAQGGAADGSGAAVTGGTGGTGSAGATGATGSAGGTQPTTTTTAPAWVTLAAGAGSSTVTGSGGVAAGAGNDPTATTPGSGAPAATAAAGPTTTGLVLPTGTCTTVPGFGGLSAPSDPPALTSATMVDTLQTGPVALGQAGAQGAAPAFSSIGQIVAGAGTAGIPVSVAVGSCLGQGGSLLAVDLTGPAGDEVQLVGSLVADPQVTTSGGTGTTTYLFRGGLQQVGGDFQEGQPLPWGLPSTFVAEVQAAQPAGTDALTIAFMAPTGADTAVGGSTGGDGSPGTGSTGTDPTGAGTTSTATDPTGTGSTGSEPTGAATSTGVPAGSA